jgi:hypothetical protein
MNPQKNDRAQFKPLTKRTRQGDLYVRRADAEMQIEKVLTLDESQLLSMLTGKRRDEADYLLDETIVYLLREARRIGKEETIPALFEELNGRIFKLLLKFRSGFSREEFDDFVQTVGTAILEKIFDTGSNAADFAEVQFGLFVLSEAKAVRKKSLVRLSREQIQDMSRGEDEDESDPLEKLAWDKELSADSRMIFEEGMRKLSIEQQTVAAMLLDGIQIESKDPREITISRHLDVDQRTIRNWIRKMRAALTDYRGEMRR